ncbi:hypothetical protein DPEC_G00019640 [Dallia pectoralis]|uniref:Uncharacterized protein n=1 Tax=Dallia pectoralis TaxID=75939 RepID=A0ACC2HG38_DALPE|nr:hypothetical protein DPEC_G00019640 [Dallia pectoralis]
MSAMVSYINHCEIAYWCHHIPRETEHMCTSIHGMYKTTYQDLVYIEGDVDRGQGLPWALVSVCGYAAACNLWPLSIRSKLHSEWFSSESRELLEYAMDCNYPVTKLQKFITTNVFCW